MTTTTAHAAALIATHDAEFHRGNRLDVAKRYVYDDDPDLPVGIPRRSRRAFAALARESHEARLPAILRTLVAPLNVVGFRPSGAIANSAAWANWQANGLDARQSSVYLAALATGAAYVRVTPSTHPGVASILPMRFDAVAAYYAAPSDEWPVEVLERLGDVIDADGNTRRSWAVWSPETRQVFTETDRGDASPEGLAVSAPIRHGLAHVPFVRFAENYTDPARSLALSCKPVADRLNGALFREAVVAEFASFRQRWAVGIALPEDETPVAPFDAAVDTVWATESPDARFGDFAQTDMTGIQRTIDDARRTLAVLCGVSPDLVDGLDVAGAKTGAVTIASGVQRDRILGLSASFGESWEQVLRFAARITGDAEGAADHASRVVWATVEAESIQATVTALATAVGSLGVPAEGLWHHLVTVLPGATADDVDLWKSLAADRSGATTAAAEFVRSGTPMPATPTPAPTAEPAGAAA